MGTFTRYNSASGFALASRDETTHDGRSKLGSWGVLTAIAVLALLLAGCSSGSSESSNAPTAVQDAAIDTDTELIVNFNAASLTTLIEADQRVGIAWSMSANSRSPKVAWQVFSPLESNSVSWDSKQNSVYVSATNLRDGASIQEDSSTLAEPDNTYRLNANGTFTVQPKNANGSVLIEKAPGAPFSTTGLAADAIINDAQSSAPYGITELPRQGTVSVTATNEISVFVTDKYDKGMILDSLPPGALTINLDTTPRATLVYNENFGSFEKAAE